MSYRYGSKTRSGSQVSGWLPSGFFNVNTLLPEIWLDAADTATITSSGSPAKVSQWNDKSVNARHVTQATAASQPTTGATTQNGLNILDFDGGDSLQASTASNWVFLHDGVAPYARYIVYKNTGTTGNLASTARRIGGTIGIITEVSSASLQNYVSTTGGTVVTNETRTVLTGRTANFNIVGFITDPGNATAADRSIYRVNGIELSKSNTGTGTPTSSNPYAALTIGADGAGDGRLTGSICEVIIWKNPTTAQCKTVETYLNNKWAVF